MNFVSRVQSGIAQCWTWLLNAFLMQLFLTLFSWPILLWWGLPISSLTMLGNIIFNPFISIFLLASAGLFFCELLGLPSGLFVIILEKLTNLWLWIIAYGSSSALIAFPQPPWWLAALIPCVAVAIIYSSISYSQKMTIAVLCSVLVGLGLFLKIILLPQQSFVRVPYGNKALWVVQRGSFVSKKNTVLFDVYGVLRNDASLASWVDFTLRPQMAKSLGAVDCDAIIIMKPTKYRLCAAQKLAESLRACTIIAPHEQVTQSMEDLFASSIKGQLQLQLVDEDILKACSSSSGKINGKKLWYIIDNLYVISKKNRNNDGYPKNSIAS